MHILIIDDHAVVRAGIKQILAEEFQGAAFGEACDGAEGLRLAGERVWDLLILDIYLPGKNGLEILAELRAAGKPGVPPVLMHSMHPEEQYAVRALKLGASGYLSKSELPSELVRAVRKILGGGKYVSASLAEHLATDLSAGSGKKPHELLSEREFQVMRMIAAGKTTSEIADELKLSAKTISTYRARLLDKMKMRTNAEIITYVIQNRLLEPEAPLPAGRC
jgi:DNA-binding NarL/FixJ family response regulator